MNQDSFSPLLRMLPKKGAQPLFGFLSRKSESRRKQRCVSFNKRCLIRLGHIGQMIHMKDTGDGIFAECRRPPK